LIDKTFIYRAYQVINKFKQGTAADSTKLYIFPVMESTESLRDVLGCRSSRSFHIINNRKFLLFWIIFYLIYYKNSNFATGLPTL